jgi:hypothetical protein
MSLSCSCFCCNTTSCVAKYVGDLPNAYDDATCSNYQCARYFQQDCLLKGNGTITPVLKDYALPYGTLAIIIVGCVLVFVIATYLVVTKVCLPHLRKGLTIIHPGESSGEKDFKAIRVDVPAPEIIRCPTHYANTNRSL